MGADFWDVLAECDVDLALSPYPIRIDYGALWPCQVAAHHGDFAQRFGFDMHDAPDDSLPLAAIGSADDIETFRRRAHPMCRFCDNGALTVAQWKSSKLEAGEWLA